MLRESSCVAELQPTNRDGAGTESRDTRLRYSEKWREKRVLRTSGTSNAVVVRCCSGSGVHGASETREGVGTRQLRMALSASLTFARPSERNAVHR